ncbi:L-threonylcarbamoyladenylate synthase [Ornithinibacillus salinisoli]|uniref:Threonylcarbamoyl-AMP synthase n=1 Tax=Ornithinibacillus salinisoli TaxID=1848459 RepID=A0ABW4VZ06_9BACI
MTETIRWNVTNNKINNTELIEEAAQLLRAGSTVAFPTETVYGLGADATNEAAVAKIFQAKGRPQDNPLIAHVATKKQLMQLVEQIPGYVDKLLDQFTPGPITFVLPSNGTCAENVTAGLSTVGVRIPDHPVAQQLLIMCDIPIAAPSANLSGKPSPTTASHVWDDLNGKIAGLVDGGSTGVGVESTVVDCTQEIPIILRPGGVTKEQLEQVVGHVMVDPALVNEQEKPKAPGMKYTHYAPEVPLWVIAGSVDKLKNIMTREISTGKRIGLLVSTNTAKQLEFEQTISLGNTLQEIAANLYDGLRKYKQSDVDLIICEAFPEVGIGQAVMNRLRKAATRYMDEQ